MGYWSSALFLMAVKINIPSSDSRRAMGTGKVTQHVQTLIPSGVVDLNLAPSIRYREESGLGG